MLGDVEDEALLNTLANTLAPAKVNTHRDTLRDVDCEASIDTSPDSLA